jgi:D-alanyl-D-alanine carboxypeptidase (penicillin-binding protein 5/6)
VQVRVRGHGWVNWKNVVLLTSVLVITDVLPSLGAEPGSNTVVTAKAAILVDNQTGEVLWQRNPDLPLPPASTTKIVTALVALQSGRLEDSLNVSAEAAHAPPSKIRLRPGWKMRLRDLVYALLLNSANDASVVIAEGLSGSVSTFAERMNAQARALGAAHTHFVNPNGLPAADHYSTVRDLATMFSRALQNPLFERIVSTKSAAVSPTAGSSRPIALRNHNRLLDNYRIQVVGKTGWTRAAKKCFVGAGSVDGRELMVAVLGSRDLWGDLKRLLEFGFSGTNRPAEDVPVLQAWAAPAAAAAGDDDADADNARSASKYTVQLAAFRRLRSATQLRNTVARSGYPVRIETVRRGGTRLYRVAVGDYANRRNAERVAKTLKKRHRQLTPLVVTSS